MMMLDAGVCRVVGVWLFPSCCLVLVDVPFGYCNGLTAALARVSQGYQSTGYGQSTYQVHINIFIIILLYCTVVIPKHCILKYTVSSSFLSKWKVLSPREGLKFEHGFYKFTQHTRLIGT